MSKCPKCRRTLSVTIRRCPKCGCDTKIFLEEKMRKLDRDPNLKFQYKFVPPPTKPKRKKSVITIIGMILFFLFLSPCIFLGVSLSAFLEFLWIFKEVFGVIILIIAIGMIYDQKKYCLEIEEYKLYQQNPEEYKLRKAIETVRYFTYESTSPKTTPTITCPYCKSTNVKKITTTSRVIGAATMGLASSNIGNQWYCNNCKSKF